MLGTGAKCAVDGFEIDKIRVPMAEFLMVEMDVATVAVVNEACGVNAVDEAGSVLE